MIFYVKCDFFKKNTFKVKVDAKLLKKILETAESPEFSGKCIVHLAKGTFIYSQKQNFGKLSTNIRHKKMKTRV